MGHEEFVMTPQSHLNLWSGTNYTGDLSVCVCCFVAAAAVFSIVSLQQLLCCISWPGVGCFVAAAAVFS